MTFTNTTARWRDGARWSMVLALGVTLAAPAGAFTINVDLGDGPLYVGTADAPDLGTVWNAYTTALGTVPLVDSGGAATSVTFAFGPDPDWHSIPGVGPPSDLTVDGLHSGAGAPPSFTIAGLVPNAVYDFYSYAPLGGSYFLFSSGVISGPASSGGAFGSEVQTVQADGAGTLSGTYCHVCPVIALPSTGFQLQTVPEPASGALLGLAVIWGGRRAIRRGGARVPEALAVP